MASTGVQLRVAPDHRSGFMRCARVERPTLCEDGMLTAEVPLVRCDEANRAVAMVRVVPGDEAADPAAGRLDVRKRQTG